MEGRLQDSSALTASDRSLLGLDERSVGRIIQDYPLKLQEEQNIAGPDKLKLHFALVDTA